ncbi:MAG: hypothetical protein WDN69_24635 [Aliidongia sp.]
MSGELIIAKATLSDGKRRTAGEDADDERTDHTSTAVIGGEAGGQAGEEGERINREREQKPAEEADSEDAENDADDKHGEDLRDKGSNGLACHHHHGVALENK